MTVRRHGDLSRRAQRTRAGLLLAAVAALACAAPASADHPAGSPAQSVIAPPPPSPGPSISGTAQDGQTLTADRGTWPGDPSLTSEWLRCDSAAANCVHTHDTDTTFVLSSGDIGSTFVLRARGDGPVPGQFRETDSAPTAVVAAIPTANTESPQISGIARQGEILSAVNGSWQGSRPLTFAYTWKRCDPTCTQAVATSSSYAPAAADVGHQLQLTVTASGPGGSDSESVMSGTIAPRPATAPGVPSGGGTGATTGTGTSTGTGTTPGATTLRRLAPFPVIAIGGRILRRRVIVSHLRVSRAPRGAIVTVRCRGRDCPFKRMRRRVKRRSGLRLRALERSLRRRTVIVIIVRKGNTIGKYTRLRIRRGAPPARIDRCIRPGERRPIRCPR